ncbi:MAG TPA: hypothetical protein VHX39_33230 [Acetobacteraceae bacterium]|nr:hypothetical protein [Acetobacteraceae bacterium]
MASTPTLSREAMADIMRRHGLLHIDDALIKRAHDLHVKSADALARLPRDFAKSVEPTHIFTVPLR